MSINNYIKDLLNIKDKNIVIDTENIIVKKLIPQRFAHVAVMLMNLLILLNMVLKLVRLNFLIFLIYRLFFS